MTKFFIFLLAVVCIFILFCWIYPFVAVRTSSLLILNAANKDEMPVGFRTTPLYASASAQFSALGFSEMIKALDKKNITVVDLREEPHGFINGNAVSWLARHNWLNHDRSKEFIIKNERERLDHLAKDWFVFVFHHKSYPVPYFISKVASEEQLVSESGLNYYRLPITDHTKPNDERVDEFVEYIKTLPKDTWLHVHCSAGKGRSSTVLTMLDMMQRPNEFSFKEFIKRQIEFGGIDLLSFDRPGKDWKYSYLKARALFLEQFHRYCQEQAPGFDVSWSSWKDGTDKIKK